MNSECMQPYAKSLLDYLGGDETAEVMVRRDDGHTDRLLASFFFRGPLDFSAIERKALESCKGRVLDVGGGAGPHSLVLQEAGFEVCAIDISPECCEVMRKRGVVDVRCEDVFDFEEKPFDTLLIMDKGIGMVETLPKLSELLERVGELTKPGGQILLDSINVARTTKKEHLEYHERMRRAGRFFGEVRLRFEYKGLIGPEFGWLHVDPDALAQQASVVGWSCKTALEDEGEYLARLTC